MKVRKLDKAGEIMKLKGLRHSENKLRGYPCTVPMKMSAG